MSFPTSRGSSPIADLTYRNYDGPLDPPVNRWVAIARNTIKMNVKKKGFWGWAILSALWYLVLIIVFYFVDTFSTNIPVGQQNPFFAQIIWKDQFLTAFGVSQMMLFAVALVVGGGAIANDNRANALLVYLSKPATKGDYLIGKWLGVFTLITLVTAAPMLAFYLYGALSYRQYGFISDNPTLLLKLIPVILIPGFFHASVVLGVSSLFKQGRIAGAAYAGIYFMSYIFTSAMRIVHIANPPGKGVPHFADNLYYFSIDGIQIGMAKALLNSSGNLFVSVVPGGGRRMGPGAVPIDAPSLAIIAPIYFGICALFLWIAWTKVRAVEVVG